VAPASPLPPATNASHFSCWRSIGPARRRRTNGARAQATDPTNSVRKVRMLGTTPTAWMAGSSRAAILAGLSILTTLRSSGPGCSITQTVTPAMATPSSQGTTRQRGDGTRPSGNSSNSRARAGRFNRKVQVASQAIQAAAGSEPGAVTKARTAYSNANAWTAATRPMPTNSQPMAWSGRRTASTSPTTANPGTKNRCGDRALKPRSRFSSNSTTARTSSTAESAVKALASRAAARSLTRRTATGRSTWPLAAGCSPSWLVFMAPLCVGVCPDARSALLGRAAALASSRTVPRSLRAS
jgi:hypothetical protein